MGDHLKVIKREVPVYLLSPPYSEIYRISDNDYVVETICNAKALKISGLVDREFLKNHALLKGYEVRPFEGNDDYVHFWQVSEGVEGGYNYGYDNIPLRNEMLSFIIKRFNVREKHCLFVVSSDGHGNLIFREVIRGRDLFFYHIGKKIVSIRDKVFSKKKECGFS